MRPLPLPDREYVREALDYDPLTGVFRWHIRPETHFPHAMACRLWNATWAGKVAGSVKPHGYRIILLRSRPYVAHRLAWLLMHGEPSSAEVDHINGRPDDNRIGNLRLANAADNSANRRTRYDSQSGITGVKVLKTGRRRFLAYICRHGHQQYLGVFTTLNEAVAARRAAEHQLQGPFAKNKEIGQ
jgi:hypothetical protein